MAATGNEPEMVLPVSLSLSFECYTVRKHPTLRPFAICGVTDDPTHDGHGVIWFLGTAEIASCPLAILTEAHVWLRHWGRRYPFLHNVVDSRNLLHRRWLKLLGFEEGARVDRSGVRFIHIIRHSERSW